MKITLKELKQIVKSIIKEDSYRFGFDEDIKTILKNNLLKDSVWRGGDIDGLVDNIISVNSRWVEMVKDKLSADEIAEKLLIYYRNLMKR